MASEAEWTKALADDAAFRPPGELVHAYDVHLPDQPLRRFEIYK